MKNFCYIQVYTTLPSKKIALDLARLLTKDRLIACAQIGPEVLSIYSWRELRKKLTRSHWSVRRLNREHEQLEKKFWRNILTKPQKYWLPSILEVARGI